jgi:EAL domain-containing protein (putative c-di-GMP-specific phosphodiesterase class I)
MWMAFQPILDMSVPGLLGYEALMRSEEGSMPHPGAVLTAAERTGRLLELGRRVRLLSAAAFAAAPASCLLFVNLHTRDLLDPELYDTRSGLAGIAGRVVLEITERASLDDVGDVLARVQRLRAMGFRIALDDLGAGYAGLSSFAALEPDFVKLDMSLVRDVHRSSIRQRLIGSITKLCTDLGMRVVAEGIETADERDAIRDLGCDLLQGHFFAKPGRAFPELAEPF